LNCFGEGANQPTLPCFDNVDIMDVTKGNNFEDKGIHLHGDIGSNNKIITDRDQRGLNIDLFFYGVSHSALIIGRGAPFSGHITFTGENSICCFASVGETVGQRVNVSVDAHNSLVYFGTKTTFVAPHFLIQGNGRKIIVGDDCMFSWGIFARNYDSHSVFDLATGNVINDAADLLIGHHVWVGQDAFLGRGVSIGSGSIIGSRSTVVADIPAAVAAAGSPAKVVRSNVSWCREPFASAVQISSTAEQLYRLDPNLKGRSE
jgi:acetyltransferase-like isoleucine patch superfamily enzyme